MEGDVLDGPITISCVKATTKITLDGGIHNIYTLEIEMKDHRIININTTYYQIANLQIEFGKNHKFKLFPNVKKDNFKAVKIRKERVDQFNEFFKMLKEKQLIQTKNVLDFIRANLNEQEQKRESIVIQVLSGRNLVSRDVNGYSDPYCSFALYDFNSKRLTPYVTTGIQFKTLHPKWENEEYVFEFNSSDSSTICGIKLFLLDYDRCSSNDFMGRFNIDVSSIPFNNPVRRFFPLHKAHGELELVITYNTIQAGFMNLHNTWNGVEEKLLRRKVHKLAIGVRNPAFDTLGARRKSNINLSGDVDEDVEKSRIQAESRRQAIADYELQRNKIIAANNESSLSETPSAELILLLNKPIGSWEGYLTVIPIQAHNLGLKSGAHPSPYIIFKRGSIEHKTTTIKKSDDPIWNKTSTFENKGIHLKDYTNVFFFYLTKEDLHAPLFLEVYSEKKLLGESRIVLSGLQENSYNKLSYNLTVPPPSDQDVPKRIGRHMSEAGYRPNFPILIVPGFGSSSLVVEKGLKPSWEGTRVWLSLAKLSAGKITSKKNTLGLWTQHLLLVDGIHDPENIRVRALDGNASVNYLDPGFVTNSLTYVMGPLIENLEDLGYTEDNLVTAPYDWRLPPSYLEKRDGYFTKLKGKIEKLKSNNKKRVVVLCHSMGNRVFTYFLNWMKEKEGGTAWIKEHVHTFVAVGAPWLGASKTIRSLVSGERFGMENLLMEKEGIDFARSIGSVNFLTPNYLSKWFSASSIVKNFMYLSEPMSSTPTENPTNNAQSPQLLRASKRKVYESTYWNFFKDECMLENVLKVHNDHYVLDPLFFPKKKKDVEQTIKTSDKRRNKGKEKEEDEGDAEQSIRASDKRRDKGKEKEDDEEEETKEQDEKQREEEIEEVIKEEKYSEMQAILNPPPVETLWNIHGINLPTEYFYFFRRNPTTGGYELDKESDRTESFHGYLIKDGIGYETKEAYQDCIKATRSGDGTVPYVSLHYCHVWKNDLNLIVDEIEGCEHRCILNNRLFFKKLIEYVAEKWVVGQVHAGGLERFLLMEHEEEVELEQQSKDLPSTKDEVKKAMLLVSTGKDKLLSELHWSTVKTDEEGEY